MSDTLERLGRFGHHPCPATDFCVEVEELGAITADKQLGLRADEPWPETRIRKAMEFIVGGDPIAIQAKANLREIAALATPIDVSEQIEGEA